MAEEFRGCVELANYCLETLGLKEDCSFRFSQWDPANTAKYEGTAEQWEHAQGVMKELLDDLGIEYKVGVDEAAFYGPKLDIQIKNVFGKEDTIVRAFRGRACTFAPIQKNKNYARKNEGFTANHS